MRNGWWDTGTPRLPNMRFLHLAFENVSRLAIECIESNRLASYTEKSTRYQKWAPDDFFVPPELDGNALRDEYVEPAAFCFRPMPSRWSPCGRWS